MRIVGTIPHPQFKITIFQHDSKYAVKFELDLYEQTYKFRSGEVIQSIEDIKKLIDASFIENVSMVFTKMHQTKRDSLASLLKESEDEFEEII